MRRTPVWASRAPLSAVTFFVFAASSVASTRRDDVNAANYINLAQSYSMVGQISRNGAFGSGTLIGSDWVLTAAHVISNGDTNKKISFDGRSYAIDNVIQFPGWTGSNSQLGSLDYALCHLSQSVTNIAPALLWSGGGEVGQIGTSVGYGGTGTGLTGNTGSLSKRAFQNMIDAEDSPLLGYGGLVSDFDNPDGTSNSLELAGIPSTSTALALEGCVTPGDSGGALFQTFNGVEVLTGVTSYVWYPGTRGANGPYGFYGDGSGYAAVGKATDWIFQTTGIRAYGVQAVPEPSTFALLGMGAAAFFRRRRKA